MSLYVTIWVRVRVTIMTSTLSAQSISALVVEVLTVQCSPCLMYSVVDVDVDIVQKSVILDPVSAPFALKTLELIINNRLHVVSV